RVVEEPEHLHGRGWQSDLLPGLAKRGLDARPVALLYDPARERELPAMMGHGRGFLREDQMWLAMVGDGHEHRRRHQIAAVERPAGMGREGLVQTCSKLGELHGRRAPAVNRAARVGWITGAALSSFSGPCAALPSSAL